MNKGKSKKKMNSYLKMILLMAAGGESEELLVLLQRLAERII